MAPAAFTSISSSRRHPMISLPIISQVYLTSKFLKASAMFFKRDQNLLNFLLKSMNVSCLVMIQTLTHIMFLTRTTAVLKSHVMWCLMRLMTLNRGKLIFIL
jgi:hypothetical protein